MIVVGGRLNLYALAAALGLWATAAAAQDIRPFVTEDLHVLPVNGFELQVGEAFTDGFRSIQTGEAGQLWDHGQVALRWGVGPNVEIWTGGTLYRRFTVDATGRKNSGIGDFSIWTKFRVWQGRDRSSALGFRLGVKLPITPAGKDFSTNQSDVYLLLQGSKEWGRFRVWANVGLGVLDNPYKKQSNDDVTIWGLAASYRLSDRWLLAGEWAGCRSSGVPVLLGNSASGRLALVYSPGCRWSLDVSAASASGSGKVFGDWSAAVGCSFRFGALAGGSGSPQVQISTPFK